MNISKCRICKNTKFQNLFNLGKLAFTGKFPKNIKINIPKKKISAEAPVPLRARQCSFRISHFFLIIIFS